MPGPSRKRTPALINEAIENGLLDPATIDERARCVLNLLKKTRKFSDRRDLGPERAVDLPEHRALIREAGGEGVVLLKNSNSILPIDLQNKKTIALIGPLTKYSAAHGGGSAMLTPHYRTTPWDALNERIGDKVKLTYAQGTEYNDIVSNDSG
jgi:beta-glucosidase